ncbi:hypothetical protein ACYOEI_14220 [Singulisphaera rosea]
MIDTRLHPPQTDRTNPGRTVPVSQIRALDRRQNLDTQQRTFQGPHQVPKTPKRFPPS